MRIGLLIPKITGGGAEKFVKRLAEELQTYQEIYVIIYSNDNKSEKYGFKVLAIDNEKFKQFRQLRRWRKLIALKKELGLDVCISFLENPNALNIISRTKKCKSYISIRNYKSKQLKGLKGKIYALIIRYLYKYADLIITNAKKSRRDLIDNFGLDKLKIKVIYNLYNIKKISAMAQEEVEGELVPIFNKGVIISFGRYEKVKGFKELIYSYVKSGVYKMGISLILMGDGSQKTELINLVNDLGMAENILVLNYKDNPYKYISRSKFFILNSYYEGFPNALVESMICGIPVISTNCLSGPSEILHDGSYNINKESYTLGIMVPTPEADNADEILASAIQALSVDDDLALKLSQLSLERANAFDKEEIISNWLEIIEGQ